MSMLARKHKQQASGTFLSQETKASPNSRTNKLGVMSGDSPADRAVKRTGPWDRRTHSIANPLYSTNASGITGSVKDHKVPAIHIEQTNVLSEPRHSQGNDAYPITGLNINTKQNQMRVLGAKTHSYSNGQNHAVTPKARVGGPRRRYPAENAPHQAFAVGDKLGLDPSYEYQTLTAGGYTAGSSAKSSFKNVLSPQAHNLDGPSGVSLAQETFGCGAGQVQDHSISGRDDVSEYKQRPSFFDMMDQEAVVLPRQRLRRKLGPLSPTSHRPARNYIQEQLAKSQMMLDFKLRTHNVKSNRERTKDTQLPSGNVTDLLVFKPKDSFLTTRQQKLLDAQVKQDRAVEEYQAKQRTITRRFDFKKSRFFSPDGSTMQQANQADTATSTSIHSASASNKQPSKNLSGSKQFDNTAFKLDMSKQAGNKTLMQTTVETLPDDYIQKRVPGTMHLESLLSDRTGDTSDKARLSNLSKLHFGKRHLELLLPDSTCKDEKVQPTSQLSLQKNVADLTFAVSPKSTSNMTQYHRQVTKMGSGNAPFLPTISHRDAGGLNSQVQSCHNIDRIRKNAEIDRTVAMFVKGAPAVVNSDLASTQSLLNKEVADIQSSRVALEHLKTQMTSQDGFPPVTARGADVHSSAFNINEQSVILGEASLFNENLRPSLENTLQTDRTAQDYRMQMQNASGAVDLRGTNSARLSPTAVSAAPISLNQSTMEEATTPAIIMQDFGGTIESSPREGHNMGGSTARTAEQADQKSPKQPSISIAPRLQKVIKMEDFLAQLNKEDQSNTSLKQQAMLYKWKKAVTQSQEEHAEDEEEELTEEATLQMQQAEIMKELAVRAHEYASGVRIDTKVSPQTFVENELQALTQRLLRIQQDKEDAKSAIKSMSDDDATQNVTQEVIKERLEQTKIALKKTAVNLRTLLRTNNNMQQELNMPSTLDTKKQKMTQLSPEEKKQEQKKPDAPERVFTVKPARWNSADTPVELLSHVQYFFKMDCPFYYDSQYQVYKLYEPIIVKLVAEGSTCKQHEGKLCSHLDVYGSFHSRLPGAMHYFMQGLNEELSEEAVRDCRYEHRFLDCEKFFVKPSGGVDKQCLQQDMHDAAKAGRDTVPYYMSIYTESRNIVNVTIRTMLKPGLHGQPRGEIVERENPLQTHLAYVSKCLADPDSFSTIKEHVNFIQKKRRVYDFLQQQFGTMNPFNEIKEKANAVNTRAIRQFGHEDLAAVMKRMNARSQDGKKVEHGESEEQKFIHRVTDEIRFDGHVQRNIALAGKPPRFSETADVLRQRRLMAEECAAHNELERRLQVIEHNRRWQTFREKKHAFATSYADKQRAYLRVKQIIMFIKFSTLCRTAAVNVIERITSIKAHRKLVWFIQLSLAGVQRRMRRYGGTMDERCRRQVRGTLTCLAQSVNDQVERRAKRRILKPFFTELQYRLSIKQRFLNFHQRIVQIQLRYQQIKQNNNTRINVLKMMWEKELQAMASQLILKGKNAPKGLQKHLQDVRLIPNNIRDACLRRYLNACKQRHALAFFQWRKRYAIVKNPGLVQTVFATRIDALRLQRELREQLFTDRDASAFASENQSRAITPVDEDKAGQSIDVNEKKAQGGDTIMGVTGKTQDSFFTEKQGKNTGKTSENDSISLTTERPPSQSNEAQILMKNAARIKRIKQDLSQSCNDVSMNEYFKESDSKGGSRPVSQEDNDNRITSFDQINLADPFPNNDGKKLRDSDMAALRMRRLDMLDLEESVYGNKHFHKDQPPTLLFVPSRAILHKIMKICLHCSDLTDLYYFF